MIIHSNNFWLWFIAPAFLILFENLNKFYRRKSSKYGSTIIRDVNLLSSNVTNLVISRPDHFKFKAGDYIYVKIPSIANNEWHPFTISSAPENTKEIHLHIRSLGNWTNKLFNYFYRYSRMDPLKQINKLKPIERRFKITNSSKKIVALSLR